MASCRKAAPPRARGVWGHAPPENFEILGALRRILEAPETIISPFANSIYTTKTARKTESILLSLNLLACIDQRLLALDLWP